MYNYSYHAQSEEISCSRIERNEKQHNREGDFKYNVKRQGDDNCFREVLFYLRRFII